MSDNSSKHIISSALILMIGNLAIKIFGLLREILIAKVYGTSVYTDAYIIANNIPTVLFAIIGSALSTTFIPMFSRIRNDEGIRRANSFTVNLVVPVIILCCILCLLGELFTTEIVKIFALGFEGEALSITVSFAKILFPSVFGMALMNLCGSYLQLHDKFTPFAIVPAIGNICIILSLIIAERLNNVYIFVWATLFGLILQVIFYLPFIIKEGILNKDSVPIFKDKYLIKLLPLVIPVLLGESVHEINSIVDKSLVSTLGTGSVSALNYAYKIINLIHGVIVASIITIVYPKLARQAAKNEQNVLDRTFSDTFHQIISVLLPVTVLVIWSRKEIVQILFMRGKFDQISSLMTSNSLACYGIGLIAMGIRELLVKLFYSKQDTKIPMVNSIISAILNILLDIFFIKKIGYSGPAIASSLVAFFSMFFLFLQAQKKSYVHIIINIRNILKVVIGTLFASLVFFTFYSLTQRHLFNKPAFYCLLFITYCLYLVIYLITQKIFNNKPLFQLLRNKR